MRLPLSLQLILRYPSPAPSLPPELYPRPPHLRGHDLTVIQGPKSHPHRLSASAHAGLGGPVWEEAPFVHILGQGHPLQVGAAETSARSIQSTFHAAVSPRVVSMWRLLLWGIISGGCLVAVTFGGFHIPSTSTPDEVIYFVTISLGTISNNLAILLLVFRVSYEPLRRVLHANKALKEQVGGRSGCPFAHDMCSYLYLTVVTWAVCAPPGRGSDGCLS
jgi:hypothetical protein